jgi:hypothetical protein
MRSSRYASDTRNNIIEVPDRQAVEWQRSSNQGGSYENSPRGVVNVMQFKSSENTLAAAA